MAGFLVNRDNLTNTSNPAGGIDPALSPNVGQYGWTSYQAAQVNQLIQYVDQCKSYAEFCGEKALYMQETVDNIILPALDKLDQVYDLIVPIFENIDAIYTDIQLIQSDINTKYSDFISKYNDFVPKYSDFIVKYGQVITYRDQAAASAAASATSAADSQHYYNLSYDLYVELSKGQVYRGTWNPHTGSYPPNGGTNSVWDVLLNEGEVTFDFDGKTWRFGERLLYLKDTNVYQQVQSSSTVNSVNGKTGFVNITLAELGGLPLTGGTLTGTTIINADAGLRVNSTNTQYGISLSTNSGVALLRAGKTDSNTSDQKLNISGQAGVGLTELKYVMSNNTNPLVRWGSTDYAIYHQGFNPTPATIGAVPASGGNMTGTLSIQPPVGSNGLNLFLAASPTGTNAQGITGWDGGGTTREWGAGKYAINGVPQFAYIGYGINPWDSGIRVYSASDIRAGATNRIFHEGYLPTPSTIGALPAVNGGISVDYWRTPTGSPGNAKIDATMVLGTVTDAKPCLIILCEKYVSTALNKNGFAGRIFFDRGGTTSAMHSDFVDLLGSGAFTQNALRMFQKSGSSVGGAKIVEVTYNSKPHYALYRPTTSSSSVYATGQAWGSFPILIPDATGYAITDIVTREELYSSVNKPTSSDLGFLPSSGGQASGFIGMSGNGLVGENPFDYGFSVYRSLVNGVDYGINLLEPNGGGGSWGTNIYGPNQSNRFIYFSKVNKSNPSASTDFDVKAKIALDNGNFDTIGKLYVGGGVSGGNLINLNSPAGSACYIFSQKAGVNNWYFGNGSTNDDVQWSSYVHGTSISLLSDRFSANKAMYAPAFNPTSDRNIKNDIVPITDCLSKVENLVPSNYRKQGILGREDGLIAQDVILSLPDSVSTTKISVSPETPEETKEILCVNYNGVVALNTGAIKELYDLVKSLQEEIAILKSKQST